MLCKSIILITGPTASGKTSLSIELAKQIGPAEIISVDSRQFYRNMDIGTAKPTLHERGHIKHHFIDIAQPNQQLSAGEYARRARQVIDGLIERDIVPILVGGSGMYWKAVIDGFYEDPTDYGQIRSALQQRLENEGVASLYSELKDLDPQSHYRLAPGDAQRIIRALEVAKKGVTTLGERWGAHPQRAYYKPVMIWLDRSRKALYKGIAERVDNMVQRGLLGEVEMLVRQGYGLDTYAMDSMGYVEVLRYLAGELEWDVAVEEIKKSTRRFAKRQTTWLRRDRRLRRLDVDQWGIDGCCARIRAQYREQRRAVFPIDS